MIVKSRANLLKPTVIAIVVVSAGLALWPCYRKFFVNEWRERLASGQPVVFVPDCPVVSTLFTCGDRFTVSFRRDGSSRWCSQVRKNAQPAGPESCGLDIDAWDYARSVRYFTIPGGELYYTWRGRVLSSSLERAGWLSSPETLDVRSTHPLAMQ